MIQQGDLLFIEHALHEGPECVEDPRRVDHVRLAKIFRVVRCVAYSSTRNWRCMHRVSMVQMFKRCRTEHLIEYVIRLDDDIGLATLLDRSQAKNLRMATSRLALINCLAFCPACLVLMPTAQTRITKKRSLFLGRDQRFKKNSKHFGVGAHWVQGGKRYSRG